VLERRGFGVDDAASYPLFKQELIALMRRLLTPDQQTDVAIAVTVSQALGCRGAIGAPSIRPYP